MMASLSSRDLATLRQAIHTSGRNERMRCGHIQKVALGGSLVFTSLAFWISCTKEEFSGDNPGPTYEPKPSRQNREKTLDARSPSQSSADTSALEANHPEATIQDYSGESTPSFTAASTGTAQPNPTGQAQVVQFVITKGTGAGPWNTPDNPIRVRVGQTLEVINEDSIRHHFHTNGCPFPHPFTSIAPGGRGTYRIQSEFSGQLYDHLNFGRIYLTTK